MKAILAGTLETGRGTTQKNATIFLDKGKIVDIAEGLDPKGASEVLDASAFVVTPGLIDAHTHIGTYCEGFPVGMADANDMVHPIAPQLRILDAIYQDDTAFEDARAVCPDLCLIGGTYAGLWLEPAEVIIETIGRSLDALPHRRGIVVTTAGEIAPGAKPETLKAVAEWLRTAPC